MKSKKIWLAALIFVIGLGGSVAVLAKQNYGVQIKTNHCKADQILQDSACTPGAILTTSTTIICVPGYTKTVRNVPTSVRKAVFKSYGISYDKRGKYEVDHLISLELGGSNDISNLWPENNSIIDGSFTKDGFENYLHAQICKGAMTAEEAQFEISSNWVKYYKTNSKTPPVKATSTVSTPSKANEENPQVKKSTSGICHERGTPYYTRTIHFIAYMNLKDCIGSGGRLPKK